MPKWEPEFTSVTVRIVRADGQVIEYALPQASDDLLELRFSLDRPLMLDGSTENGDQKRAAGPVSFLQVSAAVHHKG